MPPQRRHIIVTRNGAQSAVWWCIGPADAHLTDDDGERLQRLLAYSERVGQAGSWELFPDTQEVLWSDNLYRIFGVEPGEIEPSFEFVRAHTYPADRERLTRAVEQLMVGEEVSLEEYRFTRPNGDRRHVRSTVAIAERRDGRPHRVIGFVQDVTDTRRAEREIAAHVALEEALVTWEDVDTGAHRLIAQLAAALDCVSGVFWVPRADRLFPRVVWHQSGIDPLAPDKSSRPLRRTSGLAARAWETRKPLSWTLTGREEGAGLHDVVPDDAEMDGALAIPAVAGEEVLAIIELTTDREIRVSERLQRSLTGIAYELGRFLSLRRGELTVALLTPREIEMLQFAAQGLSGRETAERLTVSPSTVKTHLENIYRKLEVSDKPSAVATALRLGVIH